MLKKYKDYLDENLVFHAQVEPSSEAAAEAKKLGLNYIGFARYADDTGQIAYVVKNNKLVPYVHGNSLKKLMTNATNDTSNDLEQQNQVANALKTTEDVKRQDIKILTQTYKDIIEKQKDLEKYYRPEDFTPEELNAIDSFKKDLFGPINTYLYKGFDETTDPNMISNIQNNISILDNVFNRSVLPTDMIVYGGLSQRYDPSNFRVDKDYVYRGYCSTSLDFARALDVYAQTKQQGYQILLQINLKKGQKALYTDSLFGEKENREVILPRGSKIKIMSGPNIIDDSIVSQYPTGNKIALFNCVAIQDI